MKLSKYTFDRRGNVSWGLMESGFTIVELLVVLVLSVVVLAGVTSGFRTFTRHSGKIFRENQANAAIKASLKLLQRDLNMAGFGLPGETRAAVDDQYETAIEGDFSSSYNCDGNAATSTGAITESCLNYDLNHDGDMSDNMFRDRLYVADGWAILKDITDNNAYDGNIVENPTNYYYRTADAKEKHDGFFATLTADRAASATDLPLSAVNINMGDEFTVADDFTQDDAILIYGHDGSSPPVYEVEGHRVGKVAGNTVSFSTGESLASSYSAADSMVVPAVAWYVEQKSGDKTYWLYRNKDKVLPGVIGFQADFGFDKNNDGLEWYSSLPPQVGVGNQFEGNTITKSDIPDIVRTLRAIRVTMSVKSEDKSDSNKVVMKTYEKIIMLKN